MKVYFISFFLVNFFTSALSRRVVCYFPNWAYSRNGDAKFTPKDVDYSKCTNSLYAFASLGDDSTSIKPTDQYGDIQIQHFTKFTKRAKDAKSKPSLSIGGWSDSGGNKYSVMLNSDSKRKAFVQNAVQFLEKYGFEGLDLDIEYPVCPQGQCDKGNRKDKEGYAKLLQELHAEFKPKGWVISAAISADPGTIDKAYDIDAMNKYMDWIGVMTYDYSEPAGAQNTGPVSPLKGGSSTESSMSHLIKKGADKNKLTVGVPFYGYSYKLKDPSQNGYGAPSSGVGIQGPYTQDSSGGTIGYYEVCDFINKGFKNVEDANQGAYIFKGRNWISYNSEQDVRNKVNYVKEQNLGGVIIWDISTDDFKGKFCGKGNYPLLSTIAKNIN